MTKRKHVSPEALDASLLPKQRKPIPHAFVLAEKLHIVGRIRIEMNTAGFGNGLKQCCS
jgi:hypothetical protein